ncbi:MAG: tripartite tricarboxylate transporter substrate binding protein [Xanthobacteraceae bacterium]|nr:tripartite tricarboxylate transporter substrate binding protein [Xanthobacteraceae bacterium]
MGRVSLRVAAALVLAGLTAHGANAQGDYPNRVVKIVNPYVAGSTTDILARGLAAGLSSRLGQQFIIENKPGAGGALGTASVARGDADGYTLLFAPALVLSVYPQARKDTGYEPAALVPVCQTFTNAMALAVAPESPIKNVADLVAAAKQKPGALNYGHQGVLTIPHLAMEEFLQTAQIDIKDIPFRGEPLVLTDLIGGRIDVASIVLGSASGQNIRVIGVFAETRHPAFPSVPTVKEQGFDVSPASFGGLMAPAATPAPVVSRLAGACAGAAKDEAYATTAKRAAQPDDYYGDAAAFSQRLKRDVERKAAVLTRVKTQP